MILRPTLTTSAIALFLLAASCGKQQSPASEEATSPLRPPAPTTAATALSPAPADTANDSSLAIKRGIVTITSDHATVRLCGDSKALWFTDLSDGRFAEMYSKPQGDAQLVLYFEAYGEPGAVPQGNAAAARYSGAFLSEQVLYVKAEPDSKICDTPAGDYKLLAVGSDAAWSLEIAGEQAHWNAEGKQTPLTFAPVTTEDSEGTVRYRAKSQGHSLDLLVAEQLCRNSATGEVFAYSAQATLDNQTFGGCARLGE